jgi:hypothetical protein
MVESKKGFIPYENESSALTIGGTLAIENRLDRVSIMGSIELTKDQDGLKYAYDLKRIIDATISELKGKDLPAHISIAEAETVENPFN